MAKITELKERNTGEVLYPKTVTTNVFTESGTKLSQELDNKASKADLSNVIGEEVIDNPLLEEINTLTREEIKKDLFIDMWNEAVGTYGTYNEETDLFELNGITDIGWDEALRIHAYCSGWHKNVANEQVVGKLSDKINIRTAYPIFYAGGNPTLSLSALAHSNSKIEAIRLAHDNTPDKIVTSLRYAFYGCTKLKHIYGTIILLNATSITVNNAFTNCRELVTVYIKGLNASLNLNNCSKLSLDSLQFMIDNAANTTDITITVHPDVYAKLIDTSNTAWNQLLTVAFDKGISLAS